MPTGNDIARWKTLLDARCGTVQNQQMFDMYTQAPRSLALPSFDSSVFDPGPSGRIPGASKHLPVQAAAQGHQSFSSPWLVEAELRRTFMDFRKELTTFSGEMAVIRGEVRGLQQTYQHDKEKALKQRAAQSPSSSRAVPASTKDLLLWSAKMTELEQSQENLVKEMKSLHEKLDEIQQTVPVPPPDPIDVPLAASDTESSLFPESGTTAPEVGVHGTKISAVNAMDVSSSIRATPLTTPARTSLSASLSKKPPLSAGKGSTKRVRLPLESKPVQDEDEGKAVKFGCEDEESLKSASRLHHQRVSSTPIVSTQTSDKGSSLHKRTPSTPIHTAVSPISIQRVHSHGSYRNLVQAMEREDRLRRKVFARASTSPVLPRVDTIELETGQDGPVGAKATDRTQGQVSDQSQPSGDVVVAADDAVPKDTSPSPVPNTDAPAQGRDVAAMDEDEHGAASPALSSVRHREESASIASEPVQPDAVVRQPASQLGTGGGHEAMETDDGEATVPASDAGSGAPSSPVSDSVARKVQAEPIDWTHVPMAQSRRMGEGIEIFNNDSPKKGIAHLVEKGLLQPTATEVAAFLRNAHGLVKSQIGDYLGTYDPFTIECLKEFVSLFDFAEVDIIEALRRFLQGMRLPGEAQKIDRMMEAFAVRFYSQHPNEIYSDQDAVYVLAYAIIMLNTDAHNPNIKPKYKMTRQQFIKNNAGLNKGTDFPTKFLSTIYRTIIKHEIRMHEMVVTGTTVDADSMPPALLDLAGETAGGAKKKKGLFF